MPLVEVEQATRDEGLAQQSGPILHVPGPSDCESPALSFGTAARMQPRADCPRFTNTPYQTSRFQQRPSAQT